MLDLEHVKNCFCPPSKFPDIGVGCPHYQDKSRMCYCCSQTALPRIQVVQGFFLFIANGSLFVFFFYSTDYDAQ